MDSSNGPLDLEAPADKQKLTDVVADSFRALASTPPQRFFSGEALDATADTEMLGSSEPNVLRDVTEVEAPAASVGTLLEQAFQATDWLRSSIEDRVGGEVGFDGPKVETVEGQTMVTLDVILEGVSRERAREIREWVYDRMAEELPFEILHRLSVFVTFRRG